MSKKVTDENGVVEKPVNYVNNGCYFYPDDLVTAHIVEDKHAERDEKGGLIFVSDGKRDIQAEIESQKCNAGLQNILKLQALRYGTIENAIIRNKERQTFADVSNIPDSVGEQAEMVANASDNIKALAEKYGVTVEQLLALKSESEFVNLVTLKTDSSEGGAE